MNESVRVECFFRHASECCARLPVSRLAISSRISRQVSENKGGMTVVILTKNALTHGKSWLQPESGKRFALPQQFGVCAFSERDF